MISPGSRTKFMSAAASIVLCSLLAVNCASAQSEIKVTVVSTNPTDHNLPVPVQSEISIGVIALNSAGTTDSAGYLPIPRDCQPGEMIQANPVDKSDFYPSERLNCSKVVLIEVRRRPFDEAGLLGEFFNDYTSPDGKKFSSVTKVRLKSDTKTVNNVDGTSVCQLDIEPSTETTIKQQTAYANPIVLENIANDTMWFNIPRKIIIGSDCILAKQKINEQLKGIANEMAGDLKVAEAWRGDQVITALEEAGVVGFDNLIPANEGAHWIRNIPGGS